MSLTLEDICDICDLTPEEAKYHLDLLIAAKLVKVSDKP